MYNTSINLILYKISLGKENKISRVVETAEVVMTENFQEQEPLKVLR